MAMAATQNIVTSTAEAFLDNKALLDFPKRAFNPNDLTALNTSDSAEALYARTYGGGEFHVDGAKLPNGTNAGDAEETREKKKERAADAMRQVAAAVDKPWYEQAFDGVKDFLQDPLGSIAKGVDGTVKAVQKTAGEFVEKPLETAGNVGSSALNLVTFGLLGESKEDIAARLEAEAAAKDAPTNSSEARENIALASEHDVVNGPQAIAPPFAAAFMNAINGGTGSVDVSKPDPDQNADFKVAAAAPARAFNPFG